MASPCPVPVQQWGERLLTWLKHVFRLMLEELRPRPYARQPSGTEEPVENIAIPPEVTAHPGETVAQVRKRLANHDLSHLPLIDETGRFLGMVPLARLLSASDNRTLETLVQPAPTLVCGTSLHQAIALATEAGTPLLAVVDREGRLTGLLPAETLLRRVQDRYGEALKRFTGILENSEQAVSAIEGQPGRRVIHRLPWLLVGTFGSMIATVVMAGFEAELRREVEVAFFIPGLVYLADAIGTQSEAIAVRGLSFSTASLRRLWWGELQTGILLGLVLALLVFPFIWIVFSASLALAVALALIFASSVATSIGLLFPWLLARLGKDPAYGSGPVATIIQDLLSLVIYFMVVSWLVF